MDTATDVHCHIQTACVVTKSPSRCTFCHIQDNGGLAPPLLLQAVHLSDQHRPDCQFSQTQDDSLTHSSYWNSCLWNKKTIKRDWTSYPNKKREFIVVQYRLKKEPYRFYSITLYFGSRRLTIHSRQSCTSFICRVTLLPKGRKRYSPWCSTDHWHKLSRWVGDTNIKSFKFKKMERIIP